MRLAKPAAAAPITAALSSARLTKYSAVTPTPEDALELYAWNAHVSAALTVPSHFAEVLTRNAVSEALTTAHGPDWPWSGGFTQSLPSPHASTYNPRRDLTQTRNRHTTTGMVIADLKFVFWEKMFTARHQRIWDGQIHNLFPNATEPDATKLRARIYDDLDHIRKLRNRLAHHEPIVTRNLAADLGRMLELVELRSSETRVWLGQLEEATTAIAVRPQLLSTVHYSVDQVQPTDNDDLCWLRGGVLRSFRVVRGRAQRLVGEGSRPVERCAGQTKIKHPRFKARIPAREPV